MYLKAAPYFTLFIKPSCQNDRYWISIIVLCLKITKKKHYLLETIRDELPIDF